MGAAVKVEFHGGNWSADARTAMDSPNPNITNERIVIPASTPADAGFISLSVGGLLFPSTLLVCSLGE